jgi:hypothetical protein
MLRLFHSYQYISNSKDIYYDKTKKHLNDKTGIFKIGFLQIPDIPNYDIVVEKYLVSKRQSKKVFYRNHTKHNMKVFITFKDDSLNAFIKELDNLDEDNAYKKTQTKYVFNLLEKNHGQFSLNQNMFDIVCVNPSYCKPIQKLNIKEDIDVIIGTNMFNLIKKSYLPIDTLHKKTHLKPNVITLQMNGGIFFCDNLISSKKKIITHFLKSKSYFIYIEDELEYIIWKQILHGIYPNKSLNYGECDNIDGYYISIKKNKCSKKSELIFIPSQIKHHINPDSLSYKINQLKEVFDINYGNIWFIYYFYKMFTIENMVKLLSIYSNKIDNPNLFSNIDNIYELSKLVIPVWKYNNIYKGDYKPEYLKINKKLYDIMHLHNSFVFDTDTDTILKSDSCCICLEPDKSFIKTECKHIYCLECYQRHVNIKLTVDSIDQITCGLCRRDLNNSQLTIVNDIQQLNPFKEIIKTLRGFTKKHRFIYYAAKPDGFQSVINYFLSKLFNTHIERYTNKTDIITNNIHDTLITVIFIANDGQQLVSYDIFKKYHFNCYAVSCL